MHVTHPFWGASRVTDSDYMVVGANGLHHAAAVVAECETHLPVRRCSSPSGESLDKNHRAGQNIIKRIRRSVLMLQMRVRGIILKVGRQRVPAEAPSDSKQVRLRVLALRLFPRQICFQRVRQRLYAISTVRHKHIYDVTLPHGRCSDIFGGWYCQRHVSQRCF